MTLIFGVPFLILLSLAYFFWYGRRASAPVRDTASKLSS